MQLPSWWYTTFWLRNVSSEEKQCDTYRLTWKWGRWEILKWNTRWGTASMHSITKWYTSGTFPCKEWQGAYLVFLWMSWKIHYWQILQMIKRCVSDMEWFGSLGMQTQQTRHGFYSRVGGCRLLGVSGPIQKCRKARGGPAVWSTEMQIWALGNSWGGQCCPGLQTR